MKLNEIFITLYLILLHKSPFTNLYEGIINHKKKSFSLSLILNIFIHMGKWTTLWSDNDLTIESNQTM